VPNLAPPPRPFAWRSPRVRLGLSAFALLGIGAVGTSAAFQDAGSSAASFSAGTVSVAVSGANGPVSASYVAAPSVDDELVPGGAGVVTHLVVHNTGSLPLQLSALTIDVLGGPVTDGGPAAQLHTLNSLLRLTSSGGEAGTDAERCAATASGDGSADAFTDAGTNPQSGTIAPGEAWRLCLRVFVPASVVTPDVVNVEDAATISIRFDAVQVGAEAHRSTETTEGRS